MMRLLRVLFKLLLMPVVLAGAAVVAYTVTPDLVTAAYAWRDNFAWWIVLAAGLGVGGLSSAFEFVRTLEHELTHLLAALLCFERPRRLVVSDSGGGEAVYTGGGNAFISLAPYFIPLFAWAAVLVEALAARNYRPAIAVMVIGGIGWHAAATLREIFIGQPDIREHGRVFSLTVVASCAVIGYALLATLALRGPLGAVDLLDRCVAAAPRLWQLALTAASSFARP